MKLDASSKTKASFLKIQPPTIRPMIGINLSSSQLQLTVAVAVTVTGREIESGRWARGNAAMVIASVFKHLRTKRGGGGLDAAMHVNYNHKRKIQSCCRDVA